MPKRRLLNRSSDLVSLAVNRLSVVEKNNENNLLANKNKTTAGADIPGQPSQEFRVDPEMLYLKSELDNFIKIIAAIRLNPLDNHQR